MFWNPGSRSGSYGSPGVFKEQREAYAVTPSVQPGAAAAALARVQEKPAGWL